MTYERGEAQAAAQSAKSLLSDIMACGDRCQVKFAPEKTQAMEVSRSHEDAWELSSKLMMGDNFITLQDSVNILGV